MDSSIFMFLCPLVLVLTACSAQQALGVLLLPWPQDILAAAPPLPNRPSATPGSYTGIGS